MFYFTHMGSATNTLMAQLNLSQTTQHHLCEAFARVDPKHGVREMMLPTAQPQNIELEGQALDVWNRFCQGIPKLAPFSIRPLPIAFLLVVRLATLRYPERPWDEATYQVVREGAVQLGENTIFKALIQAVDGSFAEFVRLSTSSMGRYGNFGEVALEECGPRHFIAHHTHDYPDISGYFLPPYIRGMMDLFNISEHATITFIRHDERTFDIELAW